MRVVAGNIIRRQEKMMSRNARKEADFQVLHFSCTPLCLWCGMYFIAVYRLPVNWTFSFFVKRGGDMSYIAYKFIIFMYYVHIFICVILNSKSLSSGFIYTT